MTLDSPASDLSKEHEGIQNSPTNEQQSTAHDPDSVRKAALSRKRKVAVIVSVLAIVVITGGSFLHESLLHEETDDAQVDGHVMPLSARIAGQISSVNVVEGQLVHAGDVIAVIDPQDYRVAAEQAEANLQDAQATAESAKTNVPIVTATAGSSLDSAGVAVANAEAGVRGAKHNLNAALANVEQAEANAAKSDADLERYKALIAKEDISKQQYDQAVAAAKANRALVVSLNAAKLAAEQSLAQAEGKLAQARADLRSAQTAPQQVAFTQQHAQAALAVALQRKAQLEQARLNLGYTVIRSPVTGIIGSKRVEVGQNVAVGQQLATVVPLNDVWVTANFKETQLKKMRVGQAVEIRVDAYGRAWQGHITNIGGGTGAVFSLLPPENATGNYVKVVQRVPVRIDFDQRNADQFNSDGRLVPGLSVEPKVRVQ